jgi:hypothetical protein
MFSKLGSAHFVQYDASGAQFSYESPNPLSAQINRAHASPCASRDERVDFQIDQALAEVDSQPAQPYQRIDNGLDVTRRVSTPGVQ